MKKENEEFTEAEGLGDGLGKYSLFISSLIAIIIILLIVCSCDNSTYKEGFSKIEKYEISSKDSIFLGGDIPYTAYYIIARNNVEMVKIETDYVSYKKVRKMDSILVVTKTIIRIPNK